MLWEVKTGSNLARICKYRVQKVEQKQQVVASEKTLWSNLLAHFDHRNFYCFTLNFFSLERWFNDWYTCLVGRRKARRAKQKFKFKTENKGENTQKRTRLIIFNTQKYNSKQNKQRKIKEKSAYTKCMCPRKLKKKSERTQYKSSKTNDTKTKTNNKWFQSSNTTKQIITATVCVWAYFETNQVKYYKSSHTLEATKVLFYTNSFVSNFF